MITRLKARNFKSLRDIDLALGPLSVLVGPNMAGKSNILDVFSFLHDVFFPPAGVTHGIQYALAQQGGPSEVLWKGGDDKLIGLGLEGKYDGEPDTGYKYGLELVVGAGDFVSVQNESFKLIRAGQETELIRRDQSALAFLGIDGSEQGRTGSTGISAFQYAPPNWDGYKFHEYVKLWRCYNLVPPTMNQLSAMTAGEVLLPDGSNLSAWLMWLQTNSPEVFERISEVLRDLFPEVVQIKTTPTVDGRVYLAVQEKDLKRRTTVWQAADGFLALTALLSLIYAPPESAGALYCIEEPENHLHPRLLETLAALLRQTREGVGDKGQSPAQLIMTTHSPYLVDHMALEDVIWFEKQKGETKAFHPSEREHLRKLVQDRELGIGDLMFSGALGEVK